MPANRRRLLIARKIQNNKNKNNNKNNKINTDTPDNHKKIKKTVLYGARLLVISNTSKYATIIFYYLLLLLCWLRLQHNIYQLFEIITMVSYFNTILRPVIVWLKKLLVHSKMCFTTQRFWTQTFIEIFFCTFCRFFNFYDRL